MLQFATPNLVGHVARSSWTNVVLNKLTRLMYIKFILPHSNSLLNLKIVTTSDIESLHEIFAPLCRSLLLSLDCNNC